MTLLSIIIPVFNEETCIRNVLENLILKLNNEKIEYEIIVVNDHSTDNTKKEVVTLSAKFTNLKVIDNDLQQGFGRAVRFGLENFSGDFVIIYMGDASDVSEDVVKYYRKLLEGWDCVFGSRFIKGAIVKDYPFLKLILNRLGNYFIKVLFNLKYNDVSNAFKAYRGEVIRDITPFISNYFNITVEIPLKAIIRGFSYTVIPINWYGRTSGVSKFSLRNLQRKYLFSILYVWIEKNTFKRRNGIKDIS